jgi:hypothetical protein
MYIRILSPYGKWKAGDMPDVQRSKALELIAAGIAAPHDGQALTEAQHTAQQVKSGQEKPEDATATPTVIVVDSEPKNKFKRRKEPRNSKKK